MNNDLKNEINRERETAKKNGLYSQGVPTPYTLEKGVKRVMKNLNTPDTVQRVEGVDYNVKKEWHHLLKTSIKFLVDVQYKALKPQLNVANSLLIGLEKDPTTFFVKGLARGCQYKLISKVLEIAPARKKEHLKTKYDALTKKIKGGQALDLSYSIKIVGKNKEVTLSSQSVTQVTQRLLKLAQKGTLEVLEYQKISRYKIPAVLSYGNDRIYISIN